VGLGDADAVRAIFRGERKVAMRKPADAPAKTRKRARAETAVLLGGDQPLFEALRAWRATQAKIQHVPPYVIFHDRTLTEIAQVKPGSRAALERINGVGESKLARYGAAVLAVVAGFAS
jgi:ATP-dependent DNA helicase RecQ